MSLSLNNICIGNVFIELSSCHSTNVFAKEMLAKSEPIEGAVIITDFQSHGKGQIGNTWHSDKGKNLTFSILLKPTFLHPKEQFLLSKITSLAIIETLSKLVNENFKIKWPNDIYFQEQKIGGILIENIVSNEQITNSIIGIGLNINQEYFKELPRAVSLKNILYNEYNLNSILKAILKKMDIYYLQLRQGNTSQINTKYLQNMLGFETERIFNEKGVLFEGIIKGVDDIGKLIIDTEKGIRHFQFKEVAWHF